MHHTQGELITGINYHKVMRSICHSSNVNINKNTILVFSMKYFRVYILETMGAVFLHYTNSVL